MSSVATSVYDELRAIIPATLSNYTELNNPYFISDDSDLMFEKGYAIGFGPASNTGRLIQCKMSIERDFIVTLTRRVHTPSRDITNRLAIEKSLFDDHLALTKAYETAFSSNVTKVRYVSDNGLEFLDGDRFGIILLSSVVQVEYFENL